MIRIIRSSCPTVLRGARADSDRYRHPDVVRELWEMQHEKCCYCECKIPGAGHAKAVEHFAPKSVFTSQRNHWPNLLLACAQCNGKKSDKYPVMLTANIHEEKIVYVKKPTKDSPAVIDPSGLINPEGHLDYRLEMKDGSLAGQIFPRGGSVLGKTTISVTGIGEAYFHKQRREHVRMLWRAFTSLHEAIDTGDESRINIAKSEIENLISNGSKFAGLAREFARKMRLDTAYGITIPSIQ